MAGEGGTCLTASKDYEAMVVVTIIIIMRNPTVSSLILMRDYTIIAIDCQTPWNSARSRLGKEEAGKETLHVCI